MKVSENGRFRVRAGDAGFRDARSALNGGRWREQDGKDEIGAYAAAVRRVNSTKRARFAANVEAVEQLGWKARKRTAGKLKIHR